MPGQFDTSQGICQVYASALLSLAEQRGVADELEREFSALVGYLRTDEEFAGFMRSAVIDEDQRRASLRRMFGQGRMSQLLLNLLLVLNDKGRLALLEQVYQSYRRQLDELRGRQEVHVTTASGLSQSQQAELERAISQAIGRQAVLIKHVRPEIIGGAVIELGDRRIDGSVRYRLQALARRIRQRGMEELQAGRPFVEQTPATRG